MEKRGISAVIATVLIILITVVAAVFIWQVVLLMSRQIDDGLGQKHSDVSIVISKGYTVYDPVKHFAFVQIKRGTDNESINKLRIIFNINGASVPFDTSYAPNANQEATYSFNFTAHNIVGQPDIVSVAPFFNLNGQDKMGEITSSVKMPIKSATVSSGASERAEDNIFVGADNRIHLTNCTVLDVENGRYVLDNDVETTGTCFNITAGGVTLDFDEHLITGPGDGSNVYGVYVNGLNGVYVYDGEIRDFHHGIYLNNSNMSLIDRMVSSSNYEDGIYILYGFNNNITNSVVDENLYGIEITVGSNNLVSNNRGTLNDRVMIRLDGVNNSTVSKNTAYGNKMQGIYLDGGSGNLVEYNNLSLNSGGIYLAGSSNNQIVGNSISFDWSNGIYLSSSGNNEFIENIVCGSNSRDVYCQLNSLGNFGTGNFFGAGWVVPCSDGWPVENTHFIDCS